MSSIRSIHTTLSELVRTENDAVAALHSASQAASNAKSAAARAVSAHVQPLVIAGDDNRYAALTGVAKASGSAADFTGMVATWKQQDEANRKERRELEEKWGTPQQVSEKARGIKQEIDTIDSALKDLLPEIGAFDATTAKIEAHNKKFAKAPITPESYDGYKDFKWGRFLLWCTFIKRGPHNAYRIVHNYEEKYGNYFEDARNIAKVRENEAKLEGDEAAKTRDYNQLLGINRRMSQLDSEYKGPEGMASSVRGLVSDLVLKSVSFGQHLLSDIKGADAEAAVASAAKIRQLSKLEATISTQETAARDTLSQLQSIEQYLNQNLDTVGDYTVYFDVEGAERSVTHSSRIAKTTAREATDAVASIGNYQPASGSSLASIETALASEGAVQLKDSRLSLDFSQLRHSVDRAVQEYEAEQRRIAEEQRRIAAAAALLVAQQEAARQEAARQEALRNPPITPDYNRVSRQDNIGAQDTGIQSPFRQNSEDISNGNRGIQDNSSNRRNDNISNGDDGIAP